MARAGESCRKRLSDTTQGHTPRQHQQQETHTYYPERAADDGPRIDKHHAAGRGRLVRRRNAISTARSSDGRPAAL